MNDARDAVPYRKRLPLAIRVPLVAGVLIFVVSFSVSLASYFEMRHIARKGAAQHVQDVLQLFATQQRTAPQLYNSARQSALRRGIAAYLSDSTRADNRVAALADLMWRAGPNVPAFAASELWSEDGRLLLTTNPSLRTAATDYPPRLLPSDSASLGKLRLVGDSIVYPVATRVPAEPSVLLVQWRHATASQRVTASTTSLIGAGAYFLLGNRDGTMWTDLLKQVARPPVDLTHRASPTRYTRDPAVGPVIAGIMPLDSTPWTFAIEFPERQVLAPAQAFLRIVMIVTVICVVLGIVLAWWFARQLTSPIRELTDAADALSEGRTSDALTTGRDDELGRLAISFDSMSRQVREAHQRLEEKVAERTNELNLALYQLRDTQQTLVRREKLAMLGQLAGGVGHELRNPLGVMNNAIYYLDMVLHDAPDTVRDYLRILRDQVKLSSKIVGDLLDMARLSPAERRPVTVNEIVTSQLARIPIPPSITLRVDVSAELPVVNVDPVQVGQVLYNLTTNAVQALGDQPGEIVIEARLDECENALLLSVCDNGPGIDSANLDQIFEPLFTTKPRGIGLGLAVSRSLAQNNGCELSVVSVPGAGATFTIAMPVQARVAA